MPAGGRLLRRPLLPKVAPQPPPTPPESQFRTLPGEYLVEPEYYYENGEYNHGYVERSGTSPPPPSEFQANSSGRRLRSDTESTRSRTVRLKSTATRSMHSVPRSKTGSHGRYILDPLYREQTNIGTYVEGQALVQPFKPRGPDGLPARVPIKKPHAQYYTTEEDEMEDAKYLQPAEFTLQDFMQSVSDAEHLTLEKVREIVYSRYNYKKIQKILADFLTPKHTSLTKVTMKPPGKCN